MTWRAFVDEITPAGVHVIFTNDDSLDEQTVRNVFDAEAKAPLRRFGKVKPATTMAEVTAFCSAELARLEKEESSDIITGVFHEDQ